MNDVGCRMSAQGNNMKPIMFVTLLLAVGLIWLVSRGNESLEAVQQAFTDCAGKHADLTQIKECVSAQLESRGHHYWYSVGSDFLTVRNFFMPTHVAPGFAPGDFEFTCRPSPRRICS
jgi:hypothetical protein